MINISGVKGTQLERGIADGVTDEAIWVSPVCNQSGYVGLTVIPGAGTGKFQTTMSSKAKVEAGTATWSDWAKGDVTATTQDAVTAVTAIRGVSVSGAITIEVVI